MAEEKEAGWQIGLSYGVNCVVSFFSLILFLNL